MNLYKLEISISGLPRRFNQGQGSSWQVRWAESKLWHKKVFNQILLKRLSPPPKPLRKAKLKLVRHSSRVPDFDGLVQSFKPVVDALKKCAIIEDDNMNVIGSPEYLWKKAKQKEGKIEIYIEEQTSGNGDCYEKN